MTDATSRRDHKVFEISKAASTTQRVKTTKCAKPGKLVILIGKFPQTSSKLQHTQG